jgi:hypothetical protein
MTEKLIPALHKMQQEGKLLVTNLLPVVGPYALGTGRYSHEHWVAGHGTLRPCEVVVVQEEERVKDATAVARTHMKTTTTTRQILAPREHINSTKWHGFKQTWTTRVLQSKHLRLREYFLLPGLLFRLHVLYPQQGPPPSDSWVWHWVSCVHARSRLSISLYLMDCLFTSLTLLLLPFCSSLTACFGKTLWKNTEESFLPLMPSRLVLSKTQQQQRQERECESSMYETYRT